MNFTDWFGGRVNKDVNSNSPGALGSAQSAMVMSPISVHSLESASGFVSWSKGGGGGGSWSLGVGTPLTVHSRSMSPSSQIPKSSLGGRT